MTPIARHVIIIGYMVSGKSTVGRQLARELMMPFEDLDEHVAFRGGMPIPDLFQRHGEARFRHLEREALRHLLGAETPSVIATGGGTPCHFDSMQRMRDRGLVVYLHLDQEEILRRLSESRRRRRPLLASLPPERLPDFVRETMATRAPFYRQAHITVDAARCHIPTLAQMITLTAHHQLTEAAQPPTP